MVQSLSGLSYDVSVGQSVPEETQQTKGPGPRGCGFITCMYGWEGATAMAQSRASGESKPGPRGREFITCTYEGRGWAAMARSLRGLSYDISENKPGREQTSEQGPGGFESPGGDRGNRGPGPGGREFITSTCTYGGGSGSGATAMVISVGLSLPEERQQTWDLGLRGTPAEMANRTEQKGPPAETCLFRCNLIKPADKQHRSIPAEITDLCGVAAECSTGTKSRRYADKPGEENAGDSEGCAAACTDHYCNVVRPGMGPRFREPRNPMRTWQLGTARLKMNSRMDYQD
ncbi:hypothetical protein Bbelb_224490 [Branchiostoma belcheri]|nr:hypothetical protein Bbelb_224490 [Branchiostoma belcheri]